MNRLISILLFLFICSNALSQRSSIWEKSDTLNNKRVAFASSFIGATWLTGTIGLSQIWYDEFQKTKFHTFDDCSDWLQMDKVGHIYTTAHLSEANYRLFRWSGISDKKSAWIGAGIGLGFQTTLEVLDGRNADWGFSWCDMAANGIGSVFFLSQQLLWNEQRMLLKFSYHPTDYADYRPEVLGSNFTERLLKDYNGQSYWLSFSPKKFMDNWFLPAWACFSIGYSVDQKLVGSEEFFVSDNAIFQSSRQLLFSLDIDVRELPIKRKWLRMILRPLHYVKIPFPTLIIARNGVSGSWLYF